MNCPICKNISKTDCILVDNIFYLPTENHPEGYKRNPSMVTSYCEDCSKEIKFFYKPQATWVYLHTLELELEFDYYSNLIISDLHLNKVHKMSVSKIDFSSLENFKYYIDNIINDLLFGN